MRKKLTIATAIGLATAGLTLGGAGSASAAGEGGACAKAGISTLRDLGALQAAAKKQVDYSAFDVDGTGDIRTDLPEGSFLSLGQVVSLHTSNPELFSWCD